MNLKMNDVKEIFNLINSSEDICITGHKSPDGDCIGSVMALYEFLKPLDKNVTVCIDGKIPFNYRPFVNEDVISQEYDGKKFDLLFILDCSDIDRLGKFKDVFNNSKKSVCIDHHKTNDSFADINVIDMSMSSTGELLYDVLKTLGQKLTKKAATYIYIAILTDTGKFSYSNTSSQTHRKTAELIDLGVEVAEIDNTVYNSKPSNVVKAYIECISSIELYYDNKFGIASITQKILEKNDADMGDIDGVVEFIREIKEVEVSCVLKEHEENSTKVSLRSKNNIDVSAISARFGGGGHAKAAGFEVKDTVENTKKLLIDTFKEYFGE
ncbi:MAG TPA: bifunctional oligoribonuclease/PAP phosphatase NrnA [Clostridiales bacterium]|nr:bifunctional oligoribonuclease/PAP phosphatase NrnA [Clostridiales bacterium]